MNFGKRKKPSENFLDSILNDLKRKSEDKTVVLPNDGGTATKASSSPPPPDKNSQRQENSEISRVPLTPRQGTNPIIKMEPDDEAESVAESEPPIVVNVKSDDLSEKSGLSKLHEIDKEKYRSPGFANLKPPGPVVQGPATETSLKQAENLRIAQQRILELEKLYEQTRMENESINAAYLLSKEREEELQNKLLGVEKARNEMRELGNEEINILKDNLSSREAETSKLRARLDELEARLQSDLRKIRVRERELENRLEISKSERTALLKSKDETILDLKRKLDQLYNELDKYKQKCIDLSYKIDNNNDQLSRTVRALRLALTALEGNENSSAPPMKKAE